MKLLLLHPGAAAVSCEDCRKYIYDTETWKRKTYKAGPRRIELPCLRPVFIPTPCEKCPKESPSRAADHKLSQKNWKTFQLYLELRAVGRLSKIDKRLARNLTIIDSVYREWERKSLGRHVAMHVAELLAKA